MSSCENSQKRPTKYVCKTSFGLVENCFLESLAAAAKDTHIKLPWLWFKQCWAPASRFALTRHWREMQKINTGRGVRIFKEITLSLSGDSKIISLTDRRDRSWPPGWVRRSPGERVEVDRQEDGGIWPPGGVEGGCVSVLALKQVLGGEHLRH